MRSYLFAGQITRILMVLSICIMALSTRASEFIDSSEAPPPEKVDQRRTVGSGSRSDCQNIFPENGLKLLVPEEKVVHYTALSQPNFYVYARMKSPIDLVFNLVIPDINADNPIIQKPLTISQPGVKQIKLPTNVKLKTGQIYLWQIGIPCKNNPERMAQALRAAVKKIPLDPDLENQLEQANSTKERMEIYQNRQIWYDLLDLVKQNSSSEELAQYIEELFKI